jgi:hypothetical protein
VPVRKTTQRLDMEISFPEGRRTDAVRTREPLSVLISTVNRPLKRINRATRDPLSAMPLAATRESNPETILPLARRISIALRFEAAFVDVRTC